MTTFKIKSSSIAVVAAWAFLIPFTMATTSLSATPPGKEPDVASAGGAAMGGESAEAGGKGMAATGATFNVYTDKGARDNHYIPSGWMGDYGDLKIDDGSKEQPEGKSCIKVTYSAQAHQGAGWAGVYWQHPSNNWGSKPGGFDLSKYKKLTFKARGAKGGEKVEFKMGGITGEQGDSDSASNGPVTLTNKWKTYSVDLAGKTLTHIIGGFCWVASRDDNPQGAVFYIDDIRYE